MGTAVGLIAIAVACLGVAALPAPSSGPRWAGAVGAIVCGIIAALFAFAIVA
ncbi:hypothetical protein ACFORO_12500 [Amycolatopsis halotolerans]|uniref:Uncharacterized protein n=1 Tax=Amycolatopsis halotolerans TaxID=330083 RepID=A0ABV7QF63_9PSEU